LRDHFRRHETHRVDVLEARVDESAEILHLELGRNLTRQALPCVARTLD
jgi:hypothetical protein